MRILQFDMAKINNNFTAYYHTTGITAIKAYNSLILTLYPFCPIYPLRDVLSAYNSLIISVLVSESGVHHNRKLAAPISR